MAEGSKRSEAERSRAKQRLTKREAAEENEEMGRWVWRSQKYLR